MFKVVMYDKNGLIPKEGILYFDTEEQAKAAADTLNFIYEDPSFHSDYTYVVESNREILI